MRTVDLLRLAGLGLLRRPVRTVLTALGLAVALGGMLIFLSLGEGLRDVFAAELGTVGPDLQVASTRAGETLLPHMDMNPAVVETLKKLSPTLGITALTPVAATIRQSLDPAQSAVFYGLPADSGIDAMFTGVRPAQGRLLDPGDAGKNVAVLGAKAAQNLGLGLGDPLELTRRGSARVVGILQPESALTDTFAFLPIEAVQRAFGVGNNLSLVALRLKNPADADRVAAALAKQPQVGGLGLKISTRADVVGNIGKVLNSADILSVCLSAIALIVGGLAVVNTVLMGVYERTREFGTLRAIGARPAFVRRLVLSETVLLSVLGGVMGLGLAGLGVRGINVYTQNLAGFNGAALTPRLILVGLGVALALGLLAGLWPARSAGRVTVVDALGRL
ncbi:ABC transporter permease [Deinococcus marmoris]|uniref:ABC transporter, permease protein n=1 Tax=Deinococcus marmoris TaxID=249408 RepID=A0A1U7NSY6_9DEIO|nr:ABC transporter permease [Deinococcus marmoris]OLV16021.1 ABC transporter, permease protein [Deinococcus marmoris]